MNSKNDKQPTAAQMKAITNRVYNFTYRRLARLLPGNRSYHYVYDKCNDFAKLSCADIEQWNAIMDEADRRDK
jgi:hypothetical protein